jgi:hypothetical protein
LHSVNRKSDLVISKTLFSPDGLYLIIDGAYYYQDSSGMYVDFSNYYDSKYFQKVTKTGFNYEFDLMSHDGKIVACYYESEYGYKTIYLINFNTGNIINNFKNEGSYIRMAFTHDDKYLVYCMVEKDTINFVDINKGDTVKQIKTERMPLWSYISISPVKGLMAAAYSTKTQNKLVLYDNSWLTVNNENKDNSSIIFPNPTNDIITLKSECGGANRFYEIYNINGMKLFQSAQVLSDGENISIDFSHYPTGVYFIQLHCGTNLSTYKIIKQ